MSNSRLRANFKSTSSTKIPENWVRRLTSIIACCEPGDSTIKVTPHFSHSNRLRCRRNNWLKHTGQDGLFKVTNTSRRRRANWSTSTIFLSMSYNVVGTVNSLWPPIESRVFVANVDVPVTTSRMLAMAMVFHGNSGFTIAKRKCNKSSQANPYGTDSLTLETALSIFIY